MTNSQYALAEQSGGRFLLGIGLSHGPFVEGVLGHKYESPTVKLTGYLEGIVAWGDEKALRARIQEHWDNGADHVCIQPLRREGVKLTAEDEKVLEVLAPG